MITNNKIKLPIYVMQIDEGDEGVNFVSLVERPAIEQNYLAFAKQTPPAFMKFAETGKRILTGVLMMANTPILRHDEERGQYYAVFPPDTIEKMVIRFFKQNNTRNVNLEHSVQVEGVYMFESYITNSARGINAPNEFTDIPDGSWIGSYKIENDEVWNNRDKFTGFSIEGYFGMKKTETDVEVQLEEFFQQFNTFLQTFAKNDICTKAE